VTFGLDRKLKSHRSTGDLNKLMDRNQDPYEDALASQAGVPRKVSRSDENTVDTQLKAGVFPRREKAGATLAKVPLDCRFSVTRKKRAPGTWILIMDLVSRTSFAAFSNVRLQCSSRQIICWIDDRCCDLYVISLHSLGIGSLYCTLQVNVPFTYICYDANGGYLVPISARVNLEAIISSVRPLTMPTISRHSVISPT
jgi:hypothetical protein